MAEHSQQPVDVNVTVSFTSMAAGNQEDYDLLDQLESEFAAGTADRVLEQLKGLRLLGGVPSGPVGALVAERHAGVP